MEEPIYEVDEAIEEPTHSANDYAAAAALIMSMAGIVKKVAKKDFVGALTDAAAVAPKVAEVAPAVMEAAPGVAEGAENVARGAAAKFGAAGGFVKKKASGAVGSVKDKFADRGENRAKVKAAKEAKAAALAGAGISLPAEKFLQKCAAVEDVKTYLPYSGCYVVLTTAKKVKEADYGKYRSAYVGSSDNLGAAVYADMIGLGNPDVYADVKFKQPVYVLFYPCPESDMEGLKKSLVIALDADTSYNKLLEM